ncbi:MAG: DsrE family protein [Candidatus Thorarchaeota archaeon]
MASIYIVGQSGPEVAERCFAPFITATTAQAQDVKVKIFLMMDGVELAKKGVAEKVQAPGFPPLPELINMFLESGGELELCSNSVKFRDISKDDLMDERITIAGAATMVDDVLVFDRTLFF